MAKVEFIHKGGPYGDCTDTYDIVTDATTIGELITALVGKDNFQTFCIRTSDRMSEACVAYARGGKIERKASQYDAMLKLKLNRASVNGGWGNMTYDFFVDGKIPQQDRKEFELVYWGFNF